MSLEQVQTGVPTGLSGEWLVPGKRASRYGARRSCRLILKGAAVLCRNEVGQRLWSGRREPEMEGQCCGGGDQPGSPQAFVSASWDLRMIFISDTLSLIGSDQHFKKGRSTIKRKLELIPYSKVMIFPEAWTGVWALDCAG